MPKLLLIGDDTVKDALPHVSKLQTKIQIHLEFDKVLFQVRVEHILGQPIRFLHCSRYTTLTDEISKLGTDIKTNVLVVSCLTNIVLNLTNATDVKTAIEKGMGALGAVIKDASRNNVGLKIYVGPCTPRNTQGFKDHARFALVNHIHFALRTRVFKLNLSVIPEMFVRFAEGVRFRKRYELDGRVRGQVR